MSTIVINEKGQRVIQINTIMFSTKRRIDWPGVEEYLKKYVGESYVIDETDEIVYIGSDFPDEYTNSNYSAKALGTIGKAKANASQVIPELIKTASNMSFRENTEEKHKRNAKFGWYRCTVRFSLPICDDKGNISGRNCFQGRMIIRHDADDKKYLYDLIDIKKET